MQKQQPEEQKKGGGFGWIGPLFFLILIFGPQIAPLISQASGGLISTGMVVPALILALTVAFFASFAIGQLGTASDMPQSRPPTPITIPQRIPRERSRSSSSATPKKKQKPPTKISTHQHRAAQKLPGPPQFEPIIDPGVAVLMVMLGIIGVVIVAVILPIFLP